VILLDKEDNLLSMDNSSSNNEDEKFITNFSIFETPRDESNVKQQLIEDINKVQTSGGLNFKQYEKNDKVERKDLMYEEKDDSMKFKIFKKYMELCNETGLMPSWNELNKFKKYYVG
jgi:hypothetical protein